ncbi:MAG: tRNA dihydrouridine synthase DusB [Geothermobacteraceae bacterium]
MQKKCFNIGDLRLANPVVLAPMAGITSLPYRRIMKEFGAALVFTEMVSCNGLVRDGRKTFELVRSCPEEAPLGIQVFGGEPEVVAEGVRRIEQYGALIDFNLGCPVSKVVRGEAGSALLRQPRRVAALIGAMRRATDRPLTVKIRAGWDAASINFLEIGHIAQAEGADAITLHPRTRAQGFGGRADWDMIAQLKQALDIPVVGSGDIQTAEDALAMLDRTGCDAVMIGRGAYGNPWLIANTLNLLEGRPTRSPSPAERLAVALRHLNYHRDYAGDRKTVFEMRKHLCWYSRGLPGSSDFRQQVNRTGQVDELIQLAESFFGGEEKADVC